MNNPTISIIIAFSNCEKYLNAALKSVVEQTYSDFECIIIDDASTDNSSIILDIYALKDSRIIPIKNSTNKGKAYNLNKGINIAQGKYIAIIDGDDINVLNRLEKQFHFLETHPDIDIVGSQMKLIDENDEDIGELLKPITSEEITKNAFLFQVMNHTTLFAKTSMMKELGYREEFGAFEDNDLFMRIFLSGYKGYNMPEKLYWYRIYSGNVNFKSTRKKALEYFKCQKNVIKLCNYKISLKERLFMYGYLITGILLNPHQQRQLQKVIKSILFGRFKLPKN